MASNGKGVVIFLKEFPEFGKFRKVEKQECEGCIFDAGYRCDNPYHHAGFMECYPDDSEEEYIFERVK